MNSKTRYCRFERGGFVEHELPDEDQPRMLFLAPTDQPKSWFALMPPTNPEDLPAFDKFLGDLVNAAKELRLTVGSDSDRNGPDPVEAGGHVDRGDGDGFAGAGTACR